MKDQAKAQVIKLMRKMIDKNTEDKEVGWTVENTSHNSAIGAADCQPIVRNIPEGTDGESRLGDRIKPKKLVVSGILALDPNFQPDTKPMICRVIIASQKDIKVSTSVTAGNVDTNHLLRPAFNGAPEVGFNGVRAALNYPINDNKFKVYYDKTFTFCPTAAASGFPLNMAQYKFRKVITKLPASFSYDAGNGDFANNFAPFLAIGYAYPDGTAADVVNTRIITSVHSKLYFEDA